MANNPLPEITAVLFDLHDMLVYSRNNITEIEIANCLQGKGYEISSQQLKAAWSYVGFIDYPKYGYKNWHSFLSRIFWRLKARVGKETIDAIVELLESDPYYLYPDAAATVTRAKESGFKTAIMTTIAYFKFKKAVQPIKKCFDLIMTGYEAGYDKSNPRMYRKVLEILKVKPEEAVMIGDEIELDTLLPKRLGMNAIWLNRERKSAAEGILVDAFVYDLNEAMEVILENRIGEG